MTDARRAAVIDSGPTPAAAVTAWTPVERGVVLASALATSMAFIDATALNVAIPALQRGLQASATEVLWTINSYGLMVATLLLLGGALGDRFGRRRLCTIGIFIFALASLACGLCQDVTMLIVARVLQGAGAALMIPASLAMIIAGVHPSRRGQAIGIWSALSVVTSALGPVLGGLLVRAGFWRGVFLINLPLAVLAVLSVRKWVSETKSPQGQHPVDMPGACFAVLTLAGLNFGLIESATRGFGNPHVIASFVAAGLGATLFLIVEQRSSHPLLPLQLFRDSTVCAVCLLALLFYSGLYGMMFFLSLNLVDVQQYDAALAGAAQLPLMLLVILLSGWAGGVYDRHGARWPLISGTCLAGFGFLALALPGVTHGPLDYWWSYLPPLLLLGTAMGITIAPLSSAMMAAISDGQAGLASGINSTVSRLSSVFGVALLGPLALVTFHHSVELRADDLHLQGTQRVKLLEQTHRLSQATPPAGLSPAVERAVQEALDCAFVDAFRAVSVLCAGAAWGGAIVATAGIRTPHSNRGTEP